jgi:nitronate monooxygenase
MGGGLAGTTPFGLSRPLRHRVVPNTATRKWCRSDGTAKVLPAVINACSRSLTALGYLDAGALIRVQSPALPAFTPLAPLNGMPNSSVDSGALYAGHTALRISEIISARQAVKDLAP